MIDKNKNYEFFGFDEAGRFTYCGNCKISLNTLTRQMDIELIDKRLQPQPFSFDLNFVQKQNYLFIFQASKTSCILVFKKESICEKICSIIHKNKLICSNLKTTIISNDELLENFIYFLINATRKSNKNPEIEILLKNIINLFENSQKEEWLLLLTEAQEISDLEETQPKENKIPSKFRKRPFSFKVENSEENSDEEDSTRNMAGKNLYKKEQPTIPTFKKQKISDKRVKNYLSIYHPGFMFFQKKIPNHPIKLILFHCENKELYYEYNYFPSNKKHYCCNCYKLGSKVTAKYTKDENEIHFIRLNRPHICEPLNYDELNNNSMVEFIEAFDENDEYFKKVRKIIKKPKYEIKQLVKRDELIKRIIIFNSENSKLCHAYYWYAAVNAYICAKCSSNGKNITAKIYNEGNEKEEYVELSYKEHVCEWSDYDPEKYVSDEKIVRMPNFEIHTTKIFDGKEKKQLIIFEKADRNLCYKYWYLAKSNEYQCYKCANKKIYVTAKILTNENQESYVILGKNEHVCDSQLYAPREEEKIIIEESDFKLITCMYERPKLFILSSQDKTMGYEFHEATQKNVFRCLGCIRSNSALLRADLCQKENKEYYVILKGNLEHECEPQTFNPKKYEEKFSSKRIDAPNFIIYQNPLNSKQPNLLVLDLKNKELCYEYNYRPFHNSFGCLKCNRKKKNVQVRIEKDKNEIFYGWRSENSHICSPIKLKSLNIDKLEILNTADFVYKKTIDESKVIKDAVFKLRPNKDGVANGELVLFQAAEDKNLCYLYSYHKSEKRYLCIKCKTLKRNVTVEIIQNDKDENCLIRGRNIEHICEPVKYQDETVTFQYDNFEFIEKNGHQHLVAFTTDDQKIYYEYFLVKIKKLFYCCDCSKLKKNVNAKISIDDNGKEFIIFGASQHICSPRNKKNINEESKEC